MAFCFCFLFFWQQTTNLNVAQAQKVAEYTAKTVEAESNKAFNDLVKKATGGLLLQDMVQRKADGTNAFTMIGGIPVPGRLDVSHVT